MIDLNKYRKNIYQNYGVRECPYYGEDGVILKIFDTIGVSQEPYCVEFGELRVLGTTTRAYRIFYKAKSLYFSFSYDLRSFYLNIFDVFKLAYKTKKLSFLSFLFNFPFKQFASTDNIENIFNKAQINKKEIDLLTIDLDSSDYYIAKKILELGYLPKLFIVEYNPSYGLQKNCTYPNDADFSPSNPRIYGASYKAMNNLFESFGYSLCFVSGFCNLFYIRKEFSNFFCKPDISKEFTDTPEKINDYINKFCQKDFVPSWLSAEELVEADLENVDFLDIG